MTDFLLMRHGEADYSGPLKWKAKGWGADLGPLTELGIQQIKDQITSIQEWKPEIIISSSTGRTLHSTLVIVSELSIPLKVEFDLHEWVPDSSFNWTTLDQVFELMEDFENNNGEWPSGENKPWEPLSKVRCRALSVLNRYLSYQRIAVVCHGIIIRSLTGQKDVKNAEIVPFKI